jgi:molybdopterin-guanine dinucleotide biosynthesis protein A
LLRRWAGGVLRQQGARAAIFVVDEVPQPTLCLLHKEMLPFLSAAAMQGRFKLYPVIEEAARTLAYQRGVMLEEILLCYPWAQADALSLFEELGGDDWEGDRVRVLTPAQRSASHLWFENLNTPEEFAEAQQHLNALDG